VVTHGVARFVEWVPDAGRDSFSLFRHRFSAAGFEQEEVAELVDRLAAESKIPIDHLDGSVEHQFLESGFFGHLAAGGLRGRLARLEMPLGKSPVLVRVAYKKEADLAV